MNGFFLIGTLISGHMQLFKLLITVLSCFLSEHIKAHKMNDKDCQNLKIFSNFTCEISSDIEISSEK